MSEVLIQVLLYGLLFLCVVASALFSGAEIAFAVANRSRMERAALEGDRRAAAALSVIDRYSRTISTILVGNNLFNIAASTALTMLFEQIYHIERGSFYASILVTVGLLIFGEIFPKIISTEYADRLARRYAPVIRFFIYLFWPVVAAVTWFVGKLEPIWTPREDEQHSTDELVTMLETIEEEGVVDEKDAELIKSAIEFPDITAREILIPRVDVAAFDADDGYDKIFDDDDLLSYSRFPVYRESLDNILGIMPTKILLKESIEHPDLDPATLLTPPLYVHMTRTVSSILRDFRRTHTYMAIVVDEFGGMMGILTIEDILEELFGEIYDETDEIEEEPVPVPTETGDVVEVDGGMNVYDLFELIGFEDDEFETEYTTVGGWATEVLDRFPAAGDSFNYKQLRVTVLEAEAMRVVRLRVEKLPDEDEKAKEPDRGKEALSPAGAEG